GVTKNGDEAKKWFAKYLLCSETTEENRKTANRLIAEIDTHGNHAFQILNLAIEAKQAQAEQRRKEEEERVKKRREIVDARVDVEFARMLREATSPAHRQRLLNRSEEMKTALRKLYTDEENLRYYD